MSILKLAPEFFNHDAQAGGFFPATHINQTFDIEKFIQQRGKNIIIEGIRGTGKTHILKMVASKYLQQFENYKVLPVYMSLARLSQWNDSEIARFRIHLYAGIVLESINTIESNRKQLGFTESEKTNSALSFLKKLFQIKPAKNFEATISEIKQLNNILLQKLTYSTQNISVRTLETGKQGVSAKIGGDTAGISAEATTEEEIEKKADLIGITLSHENAADFILEYFKQLKTILGLSFTLILMDECSEANKEGQIEVFRLLKLIRGAADADMHQNYLYFLAAAYPPQATHYPSRTLGDSFNFELGHDATAEYLELDENLDEYESFFGELTKKRLQFLGGNGFSAGNGVIGDIFDSDKAFVIAAYAANGIPRRYMEILNQAYGNLQQRTAANKDSADIQKISVRDVESAIQTVVASSILVQNKLTAKDFQLLDELVNRLGKRNKKQETENKEKEKPIPATVYFTMSRAQMTELANLIIQGAIHDKGRTRVRKWYRAEALQGELMALDLAVAFYNGAIDKTRAADIFRKDLRNNSKSGYEWCGDFDLTKFKAFKKSI